MTCLSSLHMPLICGERARRAGAGAPGRALQFSFPQLICAHDTTGSYLSSIPRKYVDMARYGSQEAIMLLPFTHTRNLSLYISVSRSSCHRNECWSVWPWPEVLDLSCASIAKVSVGPDEFSSPQHMGRGQGWGHEGAGWGRRRRWDMLHQIPQPRRFSFVI